MQTYRTYAKDVFINFRGIEGSFCNKPRGGLWGCRGDEWWEWSNNEDFPCADTYFEWELKEGTNVYTIEGLNDFVYLLKKYPNSSSGSPLVDSIDFIKMFMNGYDAVEITREANNELHFGVNVIVNVNAKNVMTKYLLNSPSFSTALAMGLNTWDIPSICVFDPRETVLITSHLKSHFTGKEIEKLSDATMRGGVPHVRN